jgi:hypothetical protein
MHDLSVLANLNARKFHVRPVEYDYVTYSRADGSGDQHWCSLYELWELHQDRCTYVDEFGSVLAAEKYAEHHRHF